MALTIAIEGKGVIANADAISDTAGGTWSEQGQGTMSLSTDSFKYGSASIGGQYASKAGLQQYDIGSGNELDFTAGTGTEDGQCWYVWINVSAIGTLDTLSTYPLCLRLSSDAVGTSNYIDYLIAGNDDKNGWDGSWRCFIIDPTKTPSRVSGTQSTIIASVRTFGLWIDTSTSARSDAFFIDQMAVGSGLRITGTSTTGWLDVVNYCTDYANRAWGMFQEREGIAYGYGINNIGDTTQAANVSFTDSGRVIQFGKSEYCTNAATGTWGSSLPVGFSGINVEDHASYTTVFEDGVIVGTTAGRSGSSFIGHIDIDVSMDLYAGNNAASVTALYGTILNKLTGVLNSGNDVDHEFLSVTFSGCAQFDPVGAPLIRNCIFSETADIDASLLWNENIDVQDCNFIANSLGAAIEHPSSAGTPYTYTNLLFSGNTFDGLNTSGVDIIVNNSGTSNAALDEGANTITYEVSAALTIVGLEDNTEVTITKRGATIDTGSDGATTLGSRNFVTGNAWTVDAYQGFLLEITSGSDIGRYYASGNSATTLYLDAELTTTASTLTYELYDENDDTEAYHIENSSGDVVYSYSSGSGDKVDIIMFHVNYQDYVIENYVLLSSDATIPVAQILDVNYYNPTVLPEWIYSSIEVGDVNATTLVMPTTVLLDTGSVPATTDFTVAGNTVSAVSLATNYEVRLTLGTSVISSDIVTVSYTAGANPVKSLDGNNITNLSNQSVTNNVNDVTAPVWTTADFEVGLVNPYTLILPVDEVLDTGSVPATTDFTVTNNTITDVSLATSQKVTLTLGTWVYEGDDTVTVSYTKGTNPIQDPSSNEAANFTTQAVTNNTHMKVERVENSNTAITVTAGMYGQVIYCTAATAVTVTIPDTLSPVEGQTLSFCQWNTGQVSIVGSGTTTIVSTSTTHKTRERYSMLTLIEAGANTDDWHCFGDLEDN